MRKLLVFQHVPFEPLGTLNAQFKDAGFRMRYVNFDRAPGARVDVARYHGLVVLGGPQSANQTEKYPHLAYEREVIVRAIDLGLPVLGICLGAQLIAASLGGRPQRGQAHEYGWVNVSPTSAAANDPLFAHFRAVEQVYQWHSDTFTLPQGAIHLAASELCANQAFRYRDLVYGLQFHLEADRPLIRRWLGTPHHIRELKARGIAIDEAETMAQCDRYLPRASELGRAIFGSFIDRFYSFRRRRAHASR